MGDLACSLSMGPEACLVAEQRLREPQQENLLSTSCEPGPSTKDLGKGGFSVPQ